MKSYLTLLVLSTFLSAGCAATSSHSEGSSDIVRNTQFTASDAQTLTIENDGWLPKKVYARFQFAEDPDNRNLGFFQTIPPGGRIVYNLPPQTTVYACDGKYWDNYRPEEKMMGTLGVDETLSFTAAEFRP